MSVELIGFTRVMKSAHGLEGSSVASQPIPIEIPGHRLPFMELVDRFVKNEQVDASLKESQVSSFLPLVRGTADLFMGVGALCRGLERQAPASKLPKIPSMGNLSPEPLGREMAAFATVNPSPFCSYRWTGLLGIVGAIECRLEFDIQVVAPLPEKYDHWSIGVWAAGAVAPIGVVNLQQIFWFHPDHSFRSARVFIGLDQMGHEGLWEIGETLFKLKLKPPSDLSGPISTGVVFENGVPIVPELLTAEMLLSGSKEGAASFHRGHVGHAAHAVGGTFNRIMRLLGRTGSGKAATVNLHRLMTTEVHSFPGASVRSSR